jgi:hypothetical protein
MLREYRYFLIIFGARFAPIFLEFLSSGIPIRANLQFLKYSSDDPNSTKSIQFNRIESLKLLEKESFIFDSTGSQ